MDRNYLQHTLKESSRSILLLGLVFAPWAYGCTYPWAAALLEGLLATVLLLWLAASVAGRRAPALPRTPLICALLLVGFGGFMAWNARFQFDPVSHQFAPIAPEGSRLPGAIDRACSGAAVFHAALMLGILLFACNAARVRVWRRRMMRVMALTGASIALLGLLQRASAAPMIFWQPGRTGCVFFGTYYYHGNAGAFLNLVLPLLAALAVRSFLHESKKAGRVLWFPALLVCLAGAVVNVSRAASFISALLVFALLLFEVGAAHRRRLAALRLLVLGTVVAGAAICVIALATGSGQAWEKWGWLRDQLNERNPRYIVTRVCGEMARDSGFWGFGPGTFAIAFPHYTNALGDAIPGVWRFAHDDYLQTLIEWGWPGAALWGVLLFGGIGKAFRGRDNPEPDRRLRFACGLALVGIALNGLVDFPFQIASLQLYAAVLAGIGWARTENPRGDSFPLREPLCAEAGEARRNDFALRF